MQEQYNDCLDQFCNVVDANQKRCSCSSRLASYSKVETAVKDANEQLNDVAQRIRYIGLSADEIRAIMSATEAELAMQGTVDNTESRNMLEEIEKLIKSPGTFVAEANSVTSLDLADIDFTDTTSLADLFNLEFGGVTSFSNMRGVELYNAAKSRCKTVLNTCKKGGANTAQISARYDIEIDKDCIAYEKGLDKMNSTLRGNVRSAKNMLEKARLAVLQNQNQYDTKGCIGALDACMKDEMVCGSDYFKCLDPTKTYIDENGQVILGKNVTDIRRMMEKYSNSDITQNFISNSANISTTVSACTSSNNDGSCIVNYLLTKIGKDSKTGLCRVVMDKCRRATYDQGGNYIPYNDVVVNYIQRAMVNIRSAQENIISDYASTCMLDIATCYNQQVSQVNTWSTAASVSSIYRVMTGACRNVALTCAYAVFADSPEYCPTDSGTSGFDSLSGRGSSNGLSGTALCVHSISEMFYQSLLCPENSTYFQTIGAADSWLPDMDRLYVNDKCLCNSGYTYQSGMCVQCPSNSTWVGWVGENVEANGTIQGIAMKGCKCNSGYKVLNGSCVTAE